jgi:hypothetical protein
VPAELTVRAVDALVDALHVEGVDVTQTQARKALFAALPHLVVPASPATEADRILSAGREALLARAAGGGS